jgi:serine/threonine-protein kinase HipA
MNAESLSVIANQQKLGTVSYHKNRLSLRYASEWQASSAAFPLSVSMPLTRNEHPHETIEAFLWGLLPDNHAVLDQWGKQFQVSSRNVFRIIEHVGEDCAGAIQFISEANEHTLLNQPYSEQVQWLSERELNERIRLVLENHACQRLSSDIGQFSLAGAQAKIALYQSKVTGAWGIPRGMTPTTHILKPAPPSFPGFVENEHFCLSLAAALGIATAQSNVIHADEIPVIVVTRYDRHLTGSQYIRIHQEDFCQARAVYPNLKYQSDGGPSVEAIANTIWDVSSDALTDIRSFADALLLNFLICGTDAHAKNFSLLLASNNQVRLAPLYDIASALPYPLQISPHKAKLAMKIGSAYHIKKIEPRHWQSCAKQLRLPAAALTEALYGMTQRLETLAPVVANDLHKQGLSHPIVQTLSDSISQRASKLLTHYFN